MPSGVTEAMLAAAAHCTIDIVVEALAATEQHRRRAHTWDWPVPRGLAGRPTSSIDWQPQRSLSLLGSDRPATKLAS